LYGCTSSVEESIVRRLKNVTSEAAHPLLLPGIFAELELSRHIRLVESTINRVEARIFELDLDYAKPGRSREDIRKRNEQKRSAWLNLTYLRNGLISWNTQIGRMYEHVHELRDKIFCPAEEVVSGSNHERYLADALTECPEGRYCAMTEDNIEPLDEPINKSHVRDMQNVGEKIQARLNAIRDEYDEKIRDCTMRIDGMAMATQWSHGETNVEVALATNRDSKVMKSISLVTMVFLPGTFFATVFSMTFFNWFPDSGPARVSSYLWVYVLITVLFTVATVGLWYFFVVHRQNRRSVGAEDDA
jgi:Mg2+ and Co2+ transporter CorA